jgi:hypothetical protein
MAVSHMQVQHVQRPFAVYCVYRGIIPVTVNNGSNNAINVPVPCCEIPIVGWFTPSFRKCKIPSKLNIQYLKKV